LLCYPLEYRLSNAGIQGALFQGEKLAVYQAPRSANLDLYFRVNGKRVFTFTAATTAVMYNNILATQITKYSYYSVA
jgi:hypothetical protein